MQKFVKGNRFTLGKRTFLILDGMMYEPNLPTWTPEYQVGNAVEFIEIDPERTYTDVFGRVKNVEIKPYKIKEPKNENEVIYNKYAAYGYNVREKEMLYALIEKGELILL